MKVSVIVPILTGEVRANFPNDSRLEIIEVRGVSPVGRARNAGLKRATGDYIAWVDADDEITEDWWPEILAVVEENEPDVVTFDAERIGWKEGGDCIWGIPPDEVSPERLLRDLYRDCLRPSMLWLYVVKRSLWEGLAFDESIRVLEDYALIPWVIQRAGSCIYIPKKLYRYMFNGASLTNVRQVEQEKEAWRIWKSRLDSAPPAFKRVAIWGVATICYWICDSLAVHPKGPLSKNVARNRRDCRHFVCLNYLGLVREGVSTDELSFHERLLWLWRFTSVLTNCWWLQKHRWRKKARLQK